MDDVMDRAETRYALVGDAQVAYQVYGLGTDAPALVQVTGLISHVEVRWESPLYRSTAERLASFARVILFDRRGAGLSDPVPPGSGALWETWTEDLIAVLDSVGCDRAAILAAGDSGPSAILFAATYPERVSALFLLNTAARYLTAPDYPDGVAPESAAAVVDAFGQAWGTEAFAAALLPSKAEDQAYLEWYSHFQRCSATPRAAAEQMEVVLQADVRGALRSIHAPTVVFQRSEGIAFLPVELGRYLAEHIPRAKLVELPGRDGWLFPGHDDAVFDLIEETITGQLLPRPPERVFGTVVFEDIVASTERAVEIGDTRWKSLLDRHDSAVSGAVGPRGRIIRGTGDGVVAVFDSPSQAIRSSVHMQEVMRSVGVRIRVGIHAGEIERHGNEFGGVGFHIAARVGALAGADEVLVSGTVKDLVVGSGIRFEGRGERELKGVPGVWKLFAVRP
jgi:pimeloyl-ACP methyl ester carboxylesterase